MRTYKKKGTAVPVRPEIKTVNPNGEDLLLHIEETLVELPPGADRLIFFDELPKETPPEKRPKGVDLSECGQYWVQWIPENDTP